MWVDAYCLSKVASFKINCQDRMVLCMFSGIRIFQTEVLFMAHLVVCLTFDLSIGLSLLVSELFQNAPVHQTSHTDDHSILSNPQPNTPLPLHVSYHHLCSIVGDSFRRRECRWIFQRRPQFFARGAGRHAERSHFVDGRRGRGVRGALQRDR